MKKRTHILNLRWGYNKYNGTMQVDTDERFENDIETHCEKNFTHDEPDM